MLRTIGKTLACLGTAVLLMSFGASSATAQSRGQPQAQTPAKPPAAPAKPLDGKKLFADKGCANCHGADAKTPLQPGYPKLAGQFAFYLDSQMRAFKTKDRNAEDSALMHAQTEALSF